MRMTTESHRVLEGQTSERLSPLGYCVVALVGVLVAMIAAGLTIFSLGHGL